MRIPAPYLAIIGATATAITGIAVYEGYQGTAYQDHVGTWTIGFGSTTTRQNQPVAPNQTITPTEAVRTLHWHANRTAKALITCLGDVPLTPGEWDAYVSWAYNVGVTRACRSTLVKKLRQTPPDYEGACRELLQWTKAGGRVLPGLVARRQAEYQRCIGQSDSLVPPSGPGSPAS